MTSQGALYFTITAPFSDVRRHLGLGLGLKAKIFGPSLKAQVLGHVSCSLLNITALRLRVLKENYDSIGGVM